MFSSYLPSRCGYLKVSLAVVNTTWWAVSEFEKFGPTLWAVFFVIVANTHF